MAQFYLVRHGQASFGTDNYDRLSELGHQQARWLGEYFAERDMGFDALVSGDLVRHRETGAGICEGLGVALPEDIHAGLNEFDFQSIVDAYLTQFPEQAPAEGAPVAAFYKALKTAMKHWRLDELSGDLPESWQHFPTGCWRRVTISSNSTETKIAFSSSVPAVPWPCFSSMP